MRFDLFVGCFRDGAKSLFPRALIAKKEVAAHLPKDMVEGLGQPLVVTDSHEILKHIEKA